MKQAIIPLLALSFMVGALLCQWFYKEDRVVFKTIQKEIALCEKDLLRSQICDYKIIASPAKE